jgi:tetratricopeptide (TPR) repeat protein/DNA-binding XRE family transcriptional regulator
MTADPGGSLRFADLLRRLRAAAGLSQEELAGRAGLSAKAVGALERGERTRPRPHTVRALARALRLADHQHAALLAAASAQRPAMAASGRASTTTAPGELAGDGVPQPGPLPPGSRMPFVRSPLFVGRAAELAAIAAALVRQAAGGGPVVAIAGMGGVGKTHLAIEVVHRCGRLFPGGVFWLSLASRDEVPLEVAACGGAGCMAIRDDFARLSVDEQVALVRREWLGEQARLLVFDNCEEQALLNEWRPASGGCRVLMTTRRSDWAPALGVELAALRTLPRPRSVELLRRFRPDLAVDAPGLDGVAHEVGDLPLALHLAGSFLHRYRAELRPEEYLAQLRRPAVMTHASMLGRGMSADVSPTRHVQSVAQTFAMSHARLDPADEVDARALGLLAGAACLAPGERIPRALLRGWREGVEERLRAADALARLDALGLVELSGDDVRLHRLVVHFVAGAGPDEAARGMVEAAVVEAGRLAAEGGLTGPHLLAAITHLGHVARAAGEAGLRAAVLWHALGQTLHAAADYRSALDALERAAAITGAVLGPDHADTAACASDVGATLNAMGRWSDAGRRLAGALAVRERALGPEHADVAATLHLLGQAHQGSGELEVAAHLMRRALEVRRRALGPDHRATAVSLTELAFLLRERGELGEAGLLLEEALAIQGRTLGPDHPDTASTLNDLGLVRWDRGDADAAIALLERAIDINRRVLGPYHPDTASNLNNLGAVLRWEGRTAEALSLFELALQIRERVLGGDHPHTAQSLNNVAGPLHDQGRLDDARRLFERSLAIRTRVLGPDHLETAQSLNNLARVLRDQDELDAARRMLERAVALTEHGLGPDHPRVGFALYNLATVLSAGGERDAARSLLERAHSVLERALGPEHPRTVQVRRDLGAAAARPGS